MASKYEVAYEESFAKTSMAEAALLRAMASALKALETG
jgi:hypothetical protein